MTEETICPHCKQPFTPRRKQQKYCCKQCQIRAYDQRRRHPDRYTPATNTTNWSAIMKRLDELGISYGQAVQEGLL